MAKLKPDSPEWNIRHLENEREMWEMLLKDPSLEDPHPRRTFIRNQIYKMNYLIEKERQVLREEESDGIRKWLSK